MDWLLPLGGLGAVGVGAFMLFGGAKILDILSPALKGIMEGIVTWAKACWHGLRTSNYGTWTLLLTTAALVHIFTPCPDKVCPQKVPSKIEKKVTTPSNPFDFNSWFR